MWLQDQPNDESACFPSKVAKNIDVFDKVTKISLVTAPYLIPPQPTCLS